jgi:hypothetical protein
MRLRRWQIWALVAVLWTLLAVVFALQIWLGMLSHGHSLARIVAYQVLVWAPWVLFSFAVAWLARRLPLVPFHARNLLLHVLIGCTIGTAHAAWWGIVQLAVKPFDLRNPTDFTAPFLKIAVGQLPGELILYGLVVAAICAGDYYTRFRERELRAAQLEASLSEARLHALELQIQPHFLFNTLNAISALVRSLRTEEALGMIAGLSDLLRYALDRAGDQQVAVEEEAEMLRRYLQIQQLRFADRLTFEIEVGPDARRAAVPVLLLQPLAENAIRHGIAPSAGPGRVGVRVFREGDELRVELLNSGRLSPRVEPGIGLSNTLARLEQLYGRRYRFDLRQAGGGVVTELAIPWSEIA